MNGQVDEDAIYDQFPPGSDDDDSGPGQGFNTWVRINDEAWFTPAAKENPAIQAFLEAPFTLNYIQFKSSHRETEYWIHKPHLAMGGEVDGIIGSVENFTPDSKIGTYVVNHDLTLAFHITRSIVLQDKAKPATGQMIHKEEGTR